jgi:glycosyltransferase involved in cell wall biosynthesis
MVFDFFNKLNNKKIFLFVKKTASQLNFDKYIHLIDNDIYRSYFSKKILDPQLSIYYRRDNLLGFNYWKGHAKRLEPTLISKSDLVVCNSPELNNFAQKHNTNSYFIGQGVDLSSYNPTAQVVPPKNISGITGPRIGYIGDITSLRLDAELIYNLALSRPNYSFIMIGPEDKHFQTHKIHQLTNVHFLGRVPKNMVPNYIAAIDVCINLQLLNEITIGNYPRKVDEYLAMGKPVVATKTETMSIFKDYVYCCSSLEEYTHSIDTAITDQTESNSKKRIEFAQTHSWENNVNYLIGLIKNNLNFNENVLQKY